MCSFKVDKTKIKFLRLILQQSTLSEKSKNKLNSTETFSERKTRYPACHFPPADTILRDIYWIRYLDIEVQKTENLRTH